MFECIYHSFHGALAKVPSIIGSVWLGIYSKYSNILIEVILVDTLIKQSNFYKSVVYA